MNDELNEPCDTVDDFVVRRILDAASATVSDPRTTPAIRKQLRGLVESLIAECLEADQRQLGWMLLNVAQTAFAIGAIAGTPAMVTAAQDARRAAGGIRSGEARRQKAEAWRVHAGELMSIVRAENPSWAREKVAFEALARWRLQDVEPPQSSRSMVDLLKKLEVSGQVPARKTK